MVPKMVVFGVGLTRLDPIDWKAKSGHRRESFLKDLQGTRAE
jgi:hypothetical protein